MRRVSPAIHEGLGNRRLAWAMNISAHLLLAVLVLASAAIVSVCEPALRRRTRHFRAVQLFAIGAAALLLPANIVVSAPNRIPSAADLLIIVASIAALLTTAAMLILNWLPGPTEVAGRRVLAIGAHPDDLELACGGTLSRLADSGYEVHTLVLSPGSVGGNAEVRPDEAIRGARLMGATRTEVLEFPDTRLSSFASELVQAIEARIKAFNPDIILTHSGNDQHQDHSAVHMATLRAGRRHPAILCFESPSVTAAFAPSVFVEIDDYVDAKNAAISMHADQRNKPYMGGDKISSMAVFRGAQGRMTCAEAFEAERVPGFSGVL